MLDPLFDLSLESEPELFEDLLLEDFDEPDLLLLLLLGLLELFELLELLSLLTLDTLTGVDTLGSVGSLKQTPTYAAKT